MSQLEILEKMESFIQAVESAIIHSLPLSFTVMNTTTRCTKTISVDSMRSSDTISRLLYVAKMVRDITKCELFTE